MEELNKQYWETRYQTKETGWDIGFASGPLSAYIGQLERKELKILIPGCGNSYEAELLYSLGFNDVHLLDITQLPLQNFAERNPDFPVDQLHCEDFFQHKGTYDLILEQTFFCALDPKLRTSYATKMNELLNENGKIAGVLFNCTFEKQGPPFGGSVPEYENYFQKYFTTVKMEPCYNSIAPRAGNELFILLQKSLLSRE